MLQIPPSPFKELSLAEDIKINPYPPPPPRRPQASTPEYRLRYVMNTYNDINIETLSTSISNFTQGIYNLYMSYS